ncbi:MAG: dTDP-glucose 4,6-dehydratase [Candidatus Omnitrophota bacterium]
MPPNILVTGGAGFIGSAFVRLAVSSGFKVTVADKLTYAGDSARLESVSNRIVFHNADITDRSKTDAILRKTKPDAIIHFAAETHVDRSILDSSPFIKTNVQGTATLIDFALKYKVKKFLHVSTDEVYGEIKKGYSTESTPLNPCNPYAVSKAAADMLVQASVRTFGLPAVIVRPCNNYGPWQYPEKFIPLTILKAMNNQKTPVFARGLNVREWIYVEDCVEAIMTVLNKGKTGEIYNIGSGEERKNIQIIKTILSVMGKSSDLYTFVKDRPGHDLRYSCNSDKIRKLGWNERHIFETGLEKTILWADEHMEWMNGKTKELRAYWRKVYQRKR